MKKTLFIIQFCLVFFVANAQKVRVNELESAIKSFTIDTTIQIIYYVDSQNSYLVPYIENALKELRLTHKKNNPMLFSNVKSLSILLSGKKFTEIMFNVYNHYNRGQTNLTSGIKGIKIDAEIANQLNKNDLFLIIGINTLQPLIEYQFTLFEFTKDTIDTQKKTYQLAPNFNSYRSSSVFIDPTAADYKEKLLYGIKQIFPEANEKPKAMLLTSNQLVNDTITVASSDTLKIEGVYEDSDSPYEKINYRWEIDTTKKDRVIPNFNPLNKIQKIKFNDPGFYTLRLKVMDCIDTSVKVVHIHVINPLKIIEISNRDYYYYFKNNDAISFTFFGYNNTRSNANTITFELLNAHDPKYEFKLLTDKEESKEFNFYPDSINKNKFKIIPSSKYNRFRTHSKMCLLEITIKDTGNQIIRKKMNMKIQYLSDWNIFYNYANLYTHLPTPSGKSTFYTNKIGVSYRFNEYVDISPSVGFISSVNGQGDTNTIKLVKPDFKASLNFHLFPRSIALDNLTLKTVWFSYPFLNKEGQNEYFHSVGFGLEYKFFLFTPNLGYSIFFNYYPGYNRNNFENINKFKMYEFGLGYIINPFKIMKRH